MNERTLRPGNIAAAAVVVGGILIIAVPQHGMSITRLVIVTVAAAAGLYALVLNAPATWWASPFDRKLRTGKRHASDELEWIRSTLSGRRQRIENGSALPPETLRLLQPLIAVALEREGIDARDSAWRDSARELLSAETWAVLITEPLKWPPRRRTLRPDKRKTAGLVHAILDELERIGAGAIDVFGHPPDMPSSALGARAAAKRPQPHVDTSRPVSP